MPQTLPRPQLPRLCANPQLSPGRRGTRVSLIRSDRCTIAGSVPCSASVNTSGGSMGICAPARTKSGILSNGVATVTDPLRWKGVRATKMQESQVVQGPGGTGRPRRQCPGMSRKSPEGEAKTETVSGSLIALGGCQQLFSARSTPSTSSSTVTRPSLSRLQSAAVMDSFGGHWRCPIISRWVPREGPISHLPRAEPNQIIQCCGSSPACPRARGRCVGGGLADA